MSYGFDKTKLSDLDKKKVKILNFQLAFENYEDNTSKKLVELSNINNSLKKLRSENITDIEADNLADKILSSFNALYNSLTKDEQDRFTFYDDDSINYKWDMNLINERKTDND